MFDTSIVKARAAAAPHRFGLLTASIAAHTAVVLAALVLSVAAVQFPESTPRQMDLFRPAAVPAIPPPLGTRDVPKSERPSAPRTEKAPDLPVTPAIIPAMTPSLEPPAEGGGEETPGGLPGFGDPAGEPGGVGEVQPAPLVQPYTPGGEVRPARVMRRVDPRYPPLMVTAKIGATVTIRCIIDREGKLRDPEIVRSSYPPFNDAVLDALQKWSFAPGTLNGKPVDTWFELTVRFEVR